jgi:hypothetical protein
VVVFQSGSTLEERVGTVCKTFLSDGFPITNVRELDERIRKVETKIKETIKVETYSVANLKQYLFDIGAEVESFSTLKLIELYIRQEIITYETMNKLVLENNMNVGFIWTAMSHD